MNRRDNFFRFDISWMARTTALPVALLVLLFIGGKCFAESSFFLPRQSAHKQFEIGISWPAGNVFGFFDNLHFFGKGNKNKNIISHFIKFFSSIPAYGEPITSDKAEEEENKIYKYIERHFYIWCFWFIVGLLFAYLTSR